MVRALLLVLAGLPLPALAGSASEWWAPVETSPRETVDVASWAAGLPEQFAVHGFKVEPTYREEVDIRRDGDKIEIAGGAPAWAERSREAYRIDAWGEARHLVCPPGMKCDGAAHSAAHQDMPSGFLATVGLISAQREGRLTGRAELRTFGRFQVICLPGEMVGIRAPILNPCFERKTGAAIAELHRRTGRFDGPTLAPDSVTLRSGERSQDRQALPRP